MNIHELKVRDVAKAAALKSKALRGKLFVTFDCPVGRTNNAHRTLKVQIVNGTAIVRAFYGEWKLEARVWWPASAESGYTKPIRKDGRTIRAIVMFRAVHLRWLNESRPALNLAA